MHIEPVIWADEDDVLVGGKARTVVVGVRIGPSTVATTVYPEKNGLLGVITRRGRGKDIKS